MDNRDQLKEAAAKLLAFGKEREPERLREAYDALDAVNLADEPTPLGREQVRQGALAKWLELVQVVDANLDPKFDPADVPETKVIPPGNSGLPAGADPASIPDPKLRDEYEKAIAASRKKAVDYRLQKKLRELDARLTPRVEKFIRDNCLSSIEDRKAAITAIEATLTDAKRKEKLIKLLPLS